MSNIQSDHLSLTEAAAICGLHTTTLSRWCRLGLIKDASLTPSGWHIPRHIAATLDPLVNTAYTIDQVSRAWQISRRTVTRLIASGELAACRLPARKRGLIRITESSLLAFESSTQLTA
jgi:excisionase family DNA binding protein